LKFAEDLISALLGELQIRSSEGLANTFLLIIGSVDGVVNPKEISIAIQMVIRIAGGTKRESVHGELSGDSSQEPRKKRRLVYQIPQKQASLPLLF
jgi:hypothetical protein